jgi:hypothetical protein
MRIVPVSMAMTLLSFWCLAQVTIEQIGDSGSVYIEQVGRHSASIISTGNGITANVYQQGQLPNQVSIESTGINNTVSVEQRNTGNGNRSFDLRINGNGASVMIIQNSAGSGNNGNGVGGGNGNGNDQSSMQINCPTTCPQGQYQYIRR